ncbi:ephrin type-A receptor 4-A-like [Acanthaster planci]|uniref:receptor protein-tyrosine kinase n=1 Tax=Acanthaster planci TaxID=133434 RepID=A0A8B7Z9Z4_ACAPL|nr:ephrin type-A receptor 4-A-like [Acanthaster planci]
MNIDDTLSSVNTGGAVDFTLVTNPALLGVTGDNDATIGAYKGHRDLTAAVSFGRQLTTGGTNSGLPSGSKELQSEQLGCQLRQIQLPEVDGLDRTGVFYCEATKPGRTVTKIQTIILPMDVHGRNIFGQNARHRCFNSTDPHDEACRGRLFCLPDPYGCSCAAGYTGLDCMQECAQGSYGADCKQTCHCAPGKTCSKDTGECSDDDCASSYYGINCQCSSREVAPGELRATEVLQCNVSFSWTKPTCVFRGGVITGFLYQLIDMRSGALLRLLNATEESVTLNGLSPYILYGFQIAATTIAGTGPFGELLSVTTLEAEPSAPVNTDVLDVDDVSVTVTWSPPDPPNGIILNYDIAYWKSTDAGSPTLRNDIGMTSIAYRVDGLDKFTTYHVQVEYRITEKPYDQTFAAGSEYTREYVDDPWYRKDTFEPGTKYEFEVSAQNQENAGKRSTAYVIRVQQELVKTKREAFVPRHYRDSAQDYIAAEIPDTDVTVPFTVGDSLIHASLYVVLEYLPNGNLRDYLRSACPNQEGTATPARVSPLTSSNLLTFGINISRGMEHLSNSGIIHRDLAARNILLAQDLTAKVSDFGLSRGEDIYVQQSMTRIPTRWLAIESLTHREYKSKSDVWSFGIVLWEIATFGATPYPGIQSKLLAQRLQDGYRMPKPQNCADEIYDLMMKCWQTDPHKRPSFKELSAALQAMNAQSDENIYMSPHIYENHVIQLEFDDN